MDSRAPGGSLIEIAKNQEGATELTKSVTHYRVRAYRDAFIVFFLAITAYFVFLKIDLVDFIVSYVDHVRAWEFDALAAAMLLMLVGSFVFILRRRSELITEIDQRTKLQDEQAVLINKLEEALTSVRTLRGLLPMCGWCKKIRDDKGYWEHVEQYLQLHTNATFTHGICPDCAEKFRRNSGTASPA
jgi:hypothetical protein